MDKRIHERKPRVTAYRSKLDSKPACYGNHTVMNHMQVGNLIKSLAKNHEDSVDKLDNLGEEEAPCNENKPL